MNLKDIENLKIYEIIAGSYAYGTNTEESDIDLRGIFVLPNDFFLSMTDPIKQVSDEKNDTTFYELRRYFELAKDCNPNITEMLYSPSDCTKIVSPEMDRILSERNIFISKKAYHSFSGYAFAQVKRSRGQNKWVNNPQSETPPDKLDFCWFVDVPRVGKLQIRLYETCSAVSVENDGMPCRPIPIKQANIDLSQYNAAKMEHMEHVYRLYEYEGRARGVFRGVSQQLVVESIPFDDEWFYFSGLLIYNEPGYSAACKDWKNYWTWKKERNEARYRTQEAGEVDFDSKNMQHCMRLLWSGRNILENGEPIVRFSGEKLQHLRDIRSGKYTHDQLMEWIEEEMRKLDKIKESSDLPESSDFNKINKLYREIIGV